MLCFVINLLVFVFIGDVAAQTQAQYEGNITFYVINSNGDWMTSNYTDNSTLLTHCNASENWSMIIHGWRESVNSTWPKAMIGNFSQARGGCVFFMDYS